MTIKMQKKKKNEQVRRRLPKTDGFYNPVYVCVMFVLFFIKI